MGQLHGTEYSCHEEGPLTSWHCHCLGDIRVLRYICSFALAGTWYHNVMLGLLKQAKGFGDSRQVSLQLRAVVMCNTRTLT